ncbi:MAG: DNA-directed RNA polymerase subunit omega [Acidobacteriota bacterium]
MTEIPEKIDSKFRFVLLASRRAEQMVRGARPRVDIASRKPTRVAMTEVLEDRVAWGYGPAPDAEPLES